MLAIHDPLSCPMPNRSKMTGIGLGLVRLLQDAGRIEEARATLSLLENGFQGVAKETKPSQKPRKTNRMKVISRRLSSTVRSA